MEGLTSKQKIMQYTLNQYPLSHNWLHIFSPSLLNLNHQPPILSVNKLSREVKAQYRSVGIGCLGTSFEFKYYSENNQ